MSDINKQPQAGVSAQNSQQSQQQVEEQTIQVQISHDGNDQLQASQAATSTATFNPTSTTVMAASQQALLPQQGMQNLQNPTIAPIPSQAGSTNITPMSTATPQQMTDWSGHGRLQVIQQPLQNPTYIQPVYNAQGQLIVPGNIAVPTGDMNQQIQVIAAGKTFQPGQMSHMLTTAQGKPFVQGQTASFPSYATIPTSGSNQTLVISQLGVLGQTNVLPQQQGKIQNMQKMITKTNVTNSNVKSSQTQQQNVSIANLVSSQTQGITSQAQTIIQPQIISPIQYTCNTQQQRGVPQAATQAMQFAPWQAAFGPTGLPQGLAWAPGTIQSPTLLTQGNQIFIRNPTPDQGGMFIHNAPASTIPQHNQLTGQQINKPAQGIENVQNKTPIPKTFSAILPNSISPQQFRPACSVSTQTGQTQTTVQQTIQIRAGPKVRTKNVYRLPSMATSQKADSGNQTKPSNGVQVLQQKLVPSPATQDNKLAKSANQTGTQIQQMQNLFQESLDSKGQILVSNGIQNGGDRAIMPMVSMSTGQMTPFMGNMIVHAVPGISAMTPSISIPAGQTVQNVPITQELIATQSLNIPVKTENAERKESGQENEGTETGAGRPGDENTSGFEEPIPGTSSNCSKADRSQLLESADSAEEKLPDENDKKVDGATSQAKATMLVKPQILTHVIDGFVIQESSEPFPVNQHNESGPSRSVTLGESSQTGEPPKKKSFKGDVDEENKVNPSKWTVAEVSEFIRNVHGCAEYADEFVLQDVDGEALLLLKQEHLISAMNMKLGPAVKVMHRINEIRPNREESKDGG